MDILHVDSLPFLVNLIEFCVYTVEISFLIDSKIDIH